MGILFIIILGICISLPAQPIPEAEKPITQGKASSQGDLQHNDSLAYIVKDFNGNIAVFEKDKSVPFKVTQVNTRNLPKKDQDLLKIGIPVHSEQELAELMEDLCS